MHRLLILIAFWTDWCLFRNPVSFEIEMRHEPRIDESRTIIGCSHFVKKGSDDSRWSKANLCQQIKRGTLSWIKGLAESFRTVNNVSSERPWAEIVLLGGGSTSMWHFLHSWSKRIDSRVEGSARKSLVWCPFIVSWVESFWKPKKYLIFGQRDQDWNISAAQKCQRHEWKKPFKGQLLLFTGS